MTVRVFSHCTRIFMNMFSLCFPSYSHCVLHLMTPHDFLPKDSLRRKSKRKRFQSWTCQRMYLRLLLAKWLTWKRHSRTWRTTWRKSLLPEMHWERPSSSCRKWDMSFTRLSSSLIWWDSTLFSTTLFPRLSMYNSCAADVTSWEGSWEYNMQSCVMSVMPILGSQRVLCQNKPCITRVTSITLRDFFRHFFSMSLLHWLLSLNSCLHLYLLMPHEVKRLFSALQTLYTW